MIHVRNHSQHTIEAVSGKLEITNLQVDLSNAGSPTKEKENMETLQPSSHVPFTQ